MSRQPGVKEALLDWGLTVHETAGWSTRGSDDFAPCGHVIHHDVIPDQPGNQDRVPPIIIIGRSDLPGPLANFWLERDGDVHLIAAGRANHAGEGSWNGLVGNSTVWGTEMNNRGTPDDVWPDEQLEAMARLAAATAEYSGFPAANVCGHKEWAPDRKIDPHTIDMDAFRVQVKLQEKEGLTVADIEALRTTMIRQHQKDRQLAVRLAEKEGRITKEAADEIVKAIDKEND